MINEIKPTLIQIDNALLELYQQIDDQSGELTKEQEEHLEGLISSSKAKVFNYCTFLDYLDSEIDFVKKRIMLAQEYAAKLSKKKQKMLDFTKFLMERSQKTKLEGDMGRNVSLRKSKSVKIDIGIDHLPSQFVRITTSFEPDKKAIKEAIESGQVIEGCSLVENKSVNY